MASSYHPARSYDDTHASASDSDPRRSARERMVGFLTERLTEELGQLWSRDQRLGTGRPRPALPAQVALLDELLTTLRAGVLPRRRELRILLFGYGTHRDYDPAWVHLLMD